MTRQIKPATQDDVQTLLIAIAMVRAAKKHFKQAGCRSTVDRLNKALSSADGALRHMRQKAFLAEHNI